MTTVNNGEAQTAIGEAVLAVSGVAFLRPARGELLRAAATARAGLPAPGTSPHHTAGIRITTAPKGKGLAVEVHVVVLRGYRAVDVTRAIRDTIRAAYPCATQAIPVHVTVTGIV